MHELKFEIILKKSEAGQYQAVCPSLPGCITEGKTKKEALIKIERAIMDYIEMALDWTANGILMLKVLNDEEKNLKDKNTPLLFPMEVKLWPPEKQDLLPKPDNGVLGMPYGLN